MLLAACSEPQAAAPVAKPTPARHFKVGETVDIGSTWKATVHSVNTSKGSDVLIPSNAGDVFILIDVTLDNVSDKEQEPYGGLWTLRGPDGTAYSTIMSSNPPSGKVEAGTPARGTLGYEAPESVKVFRLAFDDHAPSSNQTIWDLTV